MKCLNPVAGLFLCMKGKPSQILSSDNWDRFQVLYNPEQDKGWKRIEEKISYLIFMLNFFCSEDIYQPLRSR